MILRALLIGFLKRVRIGTRDTRLFDSSLLRSIIRIFIPPSSFRLIIPIVFPLRSVFPPLRYSNRPLLSSLRSSLLPSARVQKDAISSSCITHDARIKYPSL